MVTLALYSKITNIIFLWNYIFIGFTLIEMISSSTASIEQLKQDCAKHVKLDLYYLQDETNSFKNDMDALKKYLPKILLDLETAFPGSRFGGGVFTDSPYAFHKDNYCYKHKFNLSSNYTPIIEFVQNTFYPYMGDSDRAEDSLSAMTVAALDDSLDWRPYGRDPKDNRLIIPVIMVVTDALFQYTAPVLPGLDRVTGKPCIGFPPKTKRSIRKKYICTQDDYTTLASAKQALTQRKITPLILSVKDTLAGWRLLLNYLNLGGVVAEISSNSSNIVNAVIQSLDDLICKVEKKEEEENRFSLNTSNPNTIISTRQPIPTKQTTLPAIIPTTMTTTTTIVTPITTRKTPRVVTAASHSTTRIVIPVVTKIKTVPLVKPVKTHLSRTTVIRNKFISPTTKKNPVINKTTQHDKHLATLYPKKPVQFAVTLRKVTTTDKDTGLAFRVNYNQSKPTIVLVPQIDTTESINIVSTDKTDKTKDTTTTPVVLGATAGIVVLLGAGIYGITQYKRSSEIAEADHAFIDDAPSQAEDPDKDIINKTEYEDFA